MFDFGSYYIKDDGETIINLVTKTESQLTLAPQHLLDVRAIAHHRLHVAGVQ